MKIAKGSTVVISNLKDGSISGVLTEDFTVSLSSKFKELMSDISSNDKTIEAVTNAATILGTISRSFGGKGFSLRSKQATTQIWDKTDPARFNMNVEFHRTFNGLNNINNVSGSNVMAIVAKFCKIPLPDETFGDKGVGGVIGMLEPPGPSPVQGFGIDQLLNDVAGIDISAPEMYINVTIGNMVFRRLLMEKAEPTFSKYTDDSGYPISCRVSFDFVSLWAATKSMINKWIG